MCPYIDMKFRAENLKLGYKYETVVVGKYYNWAWLDPDFLQTAFAPSESGGRNQSESNMFA